MKTKLLYMNDCYLREFSAVVIDINENKIVLDRTAFYPSGGGQPSDVGKLNELNVARVVKENGEVWHYIDGNLKAGDKVHGVIDWDRRYRFMRSHTAAHVVSGVFHKETGALITGNQIDIDKIRIDFNLENFDRQKIDLYFKKANEIIAMDLKVSVSFMLRQEAEKDKTLFRLACALPPAVNELRIVDIEGFDRQADGGTHVKSLSEVGEIEFIKAENKGMNNRRVYFKLK